MAPPPPARCRRRPRRRIRGASPCSSAHFRLEAPLELLLFSRQEGKQEARERHARSPPLQCKGRFRRGGSLSGSKKSGGKKKFETNRKNTSTSWPLHQNSLSLSLSVGYSFSLPPLAFLLVTNNSIPLESLSPSPFSIGASQQEAKQSRARRLKNEQFSLSSLFFCLPLATSRLPLEKGTTHADETTRPTPLKPSLPLQASARAPAPSGTGALHSQHWKRTRIVSL